MRATQMKDLVSQLKVNNDAIPELVQMVLEKVIGHNEGECVFYYLEGTSMKVIFKEQQIVRQADGNNSDLLQQKKRNNVAINDLI